MNLKTEKIVVILLVSTLISSVLASTIPKVRAVTPAVKVMPQALEFGPAPVVGTQFTITMEVQDVLDLYGVDIQFGWNTTWIEYVSRTVHIPVETYVDGILHQIVLTFRNVVDETASIPGAEPGTMYWLAAASMAPAPSFDGNGIAFDMVFNITNQPGVGEADAIFDLKITQSRLSNSTGWPILHDAFDATVTIRALSMPGDADGDGDVDYDDLVILAGAYGSSSGSPAYDARADFDEDGDVDYDDLVVLAGNYGMP